MERRPREENGGILGWFETFESFARLNFDAAQFLILERSCPWNAKNEDKSSVVDLPIFVSFETISVLFECPP